ncbi:hypothetical protein [Maridesulfovibrio ferrireducens]|uniref:hypothetical protein n=1 Tax=Maridesulfovibrio ferrireducens TaxID=246191 RepID=UPI001A2526F5|nr:hypothetical protein [Maridesulfovibrio ferrireducens]MBI9112299.1 hypothetical protein [Maridesulfovibrio ferrireducens]
MRLDMKKVSGILLALVVLMSAGCAHLDVSHLSRKPWQLESPSSVSMEFMKFDYQVIPRKDSFGVRGTAFIKKANVPSWAQWIGELWIQGYLSDEDGIVLAQGIQVFSPEKLEEGLGVPFDFELKPEQLDSGPLFISFGYRLVLLKEKQGDTSPPFMAIERAVSH